MGAGVGNSRTWRCLRHRLGGGDGDQKNPKILIREVFRVKRGIPPQLEALFSSVKNSQLPSEAGSSGIWGGRDGSRRRIGKGFPSHPNVAPVRNHGTVGLGSDLQRSLIPTFFHGWEYRESHGICWSWLSRERSPDAAGAWPGFRDFKAPEFLKKTRNRAVGRIQNSSGIAESF